MKVLKLTSTGIVYGSSGILRPCRLQYKMGNSSKNEHDNSYKTVSATTMRYPIAPLGDFTLIGETFVQKKTLSVSANSDFYNNSFKMETIDLFRNG